MTDLNTSEFDEVIREHIQLRIAELEPDTIYILKDIIDDNVWVGLSSGERKHAGQLMAYLVRNHYLPMVLVGRSVENAKQYQLK